MSDTQPLPFPDPPRRFASTAWRDQPVPTDTEVHALVSARVLMDLDVHVRPGEIPTEEILAAARIALGADENGYLPTGQRVGITVYAASDASAA
jgi:hypothetical protein